LSTHKHYGRAALLALSSYSGWTLSDALLKLVRQENIPSGQILLISGLSGVVVVFLMAALRGNISRLQPHRWRGFVLLGLCQLTAFICWLNALPHLPLPTMYAVAFLTPMAVAASATILFKEHLGWKRGTAIAVGFSGVIIAVNPANLLRNSSEWFPYLYVFGSMAATAGQMLLLRAAGRRQESSESMSFYPRMVLVLAGLVACAATGFVEMKPWVFLAVCTSGALGGLGWALMAKAYKYAPAALVAPFHYSQMVTGGLLGYFIWGNVPNAYLLSGASVIIASGIYLVRHERRASRLMTRSDEV
jgi:drug/metabolite transporter (DMT)-like permease